jgi:hypothetical protein
MLQESQRQNLTLINLLKSGDAYTFATLQANGTPTVDIDQPVPMDDYSEAQRWEQYAAQAQGLGEVIYDDSYAADAAELFGTTEPDSAGKS